MPRNLLLININRGVTVVGLLKNRWIRNETLETISSISFKIRSKALYSTLNNINLNYKSEMSCNDNLLIRLIASSVNIADRAGVIIRDVMKAGNLKIVDKGINDFQTEADRRAQRCILASLHKKFPSVTVIGEEEETDEKADWVELGQSEEVMSQAANLPQDLKSVDPSDICVWVDPLDGTNEYTQGYLDHVTVLIGVAVKGRAVGGVIHQPYYNDQSSHSGRTIWGIVGLGAFGLDVQAPPTGCRKVLTTRSHETDLVRKAVEACDVTEVIKVGGAGFKVLYLIEGKAHAYLFANPGCKKWDTCAPEAILRALGGHLTDVHGQEMSYFPNVRYPNDGGVVATAKGEDHGWYINRIPQEVKDELKGE